MDSKEFGLILRGIRKDKGLTLLELGERTGFSKSYLSLIENGKSNTIPKPDTLMKLSQGLNFDYYQLMHLAGYIGRDGYLEYDDYGYYEDDEDDEENQYKITERTPSHPVSEWKEDETKQRIDRESNKTPNFYMDIDGRYNGEVKTVPHFELHALLTSNIGVSFNMEPLTDEDKKNIIKFIKTFIISRS